ncbi:hypothetical protein EIP91_012244 [Steccherinum ochraceum]|uniref:Uncharacterized protein n=1 Tax=Steccherinum ochraceum TaxID=92696 RepID=A0A4V2MWU3_9APHY|nr:hypothetical protein EIP91_012244 [Steccherinum ochraceum]
MDQQPTSLITSESSSSQSTVTEELPQPTLVPGKGAIKPKKPTKKFSMSTKKRRSKAQIASQQRNLAAANAANKEARTNPVHRTTTIQSPARQEALDLAAPHFEEGAEPKKRKVNLTSAIGKGGVQRR